MDAIVMRIVPSAPVTVEKLVARASGEVGMPLVALPAVGRGTDLSGVSLMTRSGRSVGVVFYPSSGDLEYRTHVVGHELWHLIRGHRCSEMAEDPGPGIRGRWTAWRRCRREAACERFAQKIGLEVKHRTNLLEMPRPIAGLMLDEAFGMRG
ncbi:hypothetical protein [Nocardia farcinica]|uniref:hypothetical protein n=1 Tax=Nocardia farcinica TaxID=37329 RepID=UPI0018951266|nr:hypothetical protein [Nocardia farcinica]UEX26374.1 hypothetical protein LMJ57_30970 [Nocardia farcinica]